MSDLFADPSLVALSGGALVLVVTGVEMVRDALQRAHPQTEPVRTEPR